MGDAASLQVPFFTFPPQQPGEPSTRNWYQELLDHPECANNPVCGGVYLYYRGAIASLPD